MAYVIIICDKQILHNKQILNFINKAKILHSKKKKNIMSASVSGFSSSDTAALERQTETGNQSVVTLEQIWNDTHRKVCSGWVRLNNFKKICLQFPDDLLQHSNGISISLTSLLPQDVKVFIMADTSYGSCCVDEIAAEHVQADSIIHFGNACRSKVNRVPVLYMYPQLPFNVDLFLQYFKKTFENSCTDKTVVNVFLDIGYHYLLENDESVEEDSFLVRIKEAILCKELHVEVFPAAAADDTRINTNDNETDDELHTCIFVGADNNNFFQLSLTSKPANWYIYDVESNTLSVKNPLTTNYIRRRYYYIEKCKDSHVLGLIVATLSANGYLDVVARLQEMAKARGIRTQIISVGRINPAKLANFMEIDCFVLIGCPFNNMYNTKDYYKPIVSVFEAEMALNPAWHERYPEHYVTDFKQLLPEGHSFLPFVAEDVPEHDISLISGSVRNTSAITESNGQSIELADVSALSECQRAVMAPSKMELMTSNTGLTFEDRTWRGLNQALGETEPAKVQKGLSGIPIRYSHV